MTASTNEGDSRNQEKQIAARAAADLVEAGNVVGLGSGSTSEYAVRFLAERVRQGLKIVGIPTSQKTKHLAEQLGIPLATREKIICWVARRFIVIADSAKQVKKLGKFPLPVEVVPFAQSLIKPQVEALGATVVLRQHAYGNPYVTDEGHHILDCM